MKLQFKFRSDATTEDREQLIASLADEGADKIEPLFPDADEADLATLYHALAEDGDVENLLRCLNRSRAVEFAEERPERHLIMPVELEEELNGAGPPAGDAPETR